MSSAAIYQLSCFSSVSRSLKSRLSARSYSSPLRSKVNSKIAWCGNQFSYNMEEKPSFVFLLWEDLSVLPSVAGLINLVLYFYSVLRILEISQVLMEN